MLDACINRVNAERVKETLRNMDFSKVVTIVGIPDDKDFLGVAEVMADISEKIILTKSSNPHYFFTERQVDVLKQKDIKSTYTNSLSEALNLAKKYTLPVVILGTTSLISDVKNYNFGS